MFAVSKELKRRLTSNIEQLSSGTLRCSSQRIGEPAGVAGGTTNQAAHPSWPSITHRHYDSPISNRKTYNIHE